MQPYCPMSIYDTSHFAASGFTHYSVALPLSGVSGLRRMGVFAFEELFEIDFKKTFLKLNLFLLKHSPDQDRIKQNIQIAPSVPEEIGFKHRYIDRVAIV